MVEQLGNRQQNSAAMSDRVIALALAVWVYSAIATSPARADSGNPTSQVQSDLVNQANAPISSVFQVRLQDAYAPAFQGRLRGQGNFFSVAITMPLPEYRLLPLPQFSLLTIPAATTLPLPQGELTAFGDVRFVDLAVIDAGHRMLFGVGPTFVFPTATTKKTGQANGRPDRRQLGRSRPGNGYSEYWRKIQSHSPGMRPGPKRMH